MEQHQQAAVISADFCSPHPSTLAISKKYSIMSDEKYIVRDVNDSVGFKVIGYPFSLHTTRVILDAADRPIVTLRKEIFTAYSRWKVFRRESSDPKDLIFSTKRSSLFQLSTKLHIFLANNVSENVCDYALKAQGWFENSCVIYAGDSSTIIAQMKKEPILIWKHKLMVTMNPNVDCVFILALIIIFEEMKSQRRRSSSSTSSSNTTYSQSHIPT